jgi:hypothetical protein
MEYEFSFRPVPCATEGKVDGRPTRWFDLLHFVLLLRQSVHVVRALNVMSKEP